VIDVRLIDVEPLDCLAWKDGEHGTTFDDGVLWVLEKIAELPAIQPERKKGKWIEYNATGKKQWMCSECCAEEKNPKVARFCYWCGADMRGEEDNIPIEYFESGGK
jgi:hypothetical protein